MDLELNKLSSFDASLESLSNAAEKLNEIATLATESLESGGLHNSTLAFCNIALESYGAPAIESSALVAMPREKTTADLIASAKEGVKKVVEHIFELMQKLWDWVKDFTKSLFSRVHAIRSRAVKLREKTTTYKGVVSKTGKCEDESILRGISWNLNQSPHALIDGMRLHREMVEHVSKMVALNGRQMATTLARSLQLIVEGLDKKKTMSMNAAFTIPRINGFQSSQLETRDTDYKIVTHISPVLPGNSYIKITAVGDMHGSDDVRSVLNAIAHSNIEMPVSEPNDLKPVEFLNMGDIDQVCSEIETTCDTIETVLKADTHELERISKVVSTTRRLIGLFDSPLASACARALAGVNRLATKTHGLVCSRALSYANAGYNFAEASYKAQTSSEAA